MAAPPRESTNPTAKLEVDLRLLGSTPLDYWGPVHYQGMEEQIGALGLVANCIILYNTLYTQRVIEKLRPHGHQITDEDLRRLSPLLDEHINLVGRYHITLAEAILRGEYRPLKSPRPIDAARA